MVERVLSFGPTNSLVGILCEPAAEQRRDGAPAVITWNVGINHRVGPYRIYVDIARKLAALGFSTLRFDVSGLGDSDFDREDSRSDSQRAMADVKEAMRVLREQRGFQRFVLVGFCSSVDAAHSLGASDPAVAGVIYLEGYGFRTPGYYLRYPLRLVDRNRWERRLRIWYPSLFGQTREGAGRLAAEREEIYVRDYPAPKQFAEDVARMVDRGLRLLFIYAGGDTTYTYRNQLFDLLGKKLRTAGVELEFLKHADHTFFVTADRERAVARVVGWMDRTFARPAQPEAPRPAASERQSTHQPSNGSGPPSSGVWLGRQ